MVKVDLEQLAWHELAELVGSIAKEMKRRNPIGINAYTSGIYQAHAHLLEIAEAEKEHPTSEA